MSVFGCLGISYVILQGKGSLRFVTQMTEQMHGEVGVISLGKLMYILKI